jgi:hypothetical protein
MVVQGIEYGLDVGQGHDLAREPTTAIIPGQGQIQVMPVSTGQDAIGVWPVERSPVLAAWPSFRDKYCGKSGMMNFLHKSRQQ